MRAWGGESTLADTVTCMHRFCVVPAAYLLLRRTVAGRREVLLQFRRGTGFMDEHWAFGAAGHVEAGESVFDAAVREAGEELDVRVETRDLVPLTVVQRRHEDDDPINQRVDFFFAADRWEGTPRLIEPEKSASLAWFALDDLPYPVVPHELRVLRGVAGGHLKQLDVAGFTPH